MQTFRVDLEEPLFLELPTGMRASLDLNVLRQAADVWFDSIIQLVNGLTIPNIEMDKKDYMRDNTFYIEQRLDGVTLTTDTAHNAVVLNCDKLTAKFRSNSFSYKIAPLMVAEGYVEVDMNTVDIGFGLGFTTQLAPDGRQLMAVTTVDVLVDINRNDIKLHIGGGFWTDLASIFTVFFKGTVVDLIRDSVTQALVTMIPTVTNNALLANDAYFSLVPNWVWDWQSPNAAIVTDTRWEVAIFGEMFDSRLGEVAPTGPFPTMPYSDSTKTAGLQGFIADWAVDDFFSTLIAIHPMNGWLNSTSLTTDLCNTFMPGISGAYGSGTPVNMYMDLSAIDNFDVNSNPEMGADFTVRLDFYPQLANGDFEEAASITLVQTNFTFTPSLTTWICLLRLEPSTSTRSPPTTAHGALCTRQP